MWTYLYPITYMVLNPNWNFFQTTHNCRSQANGYTMSNIMKTRNFKFKKEPIICNIFFSWIKAMAIWGGSLKYTAFFFNVLTFCYLVPPLLSLFWEKSKPMEERDRNISVNSADCVWICIVGGGQKNTKVDFQLACKLIPSSWPLLFPKT